MSASPFPENMVSLNPATGAGWTAELEIKHGIIPPKIYPIGLADVAAVAKGLYEGQLSIIGARTGVGKSAVAEHIALAASTATKVLFWPFEMGIERTERRLMAKLMRISVTEYEAALTQGQQQDLDDFLLASQRLQSRNLDLYVPEEKEFDVDQIIAMTIRTGANIVILDYVRYIKGWLGFGNRSDLGAVAIVKRFQKFARQSGVHVCLVSQCKREAEGKRPTLADLQDSAALEQSADLVLLLHRPFRYQRSKDHIVEIIVAKNRNGPACRTHVRWVGQNMSFWDLSEEEKRRGFDCCRTRKATTGQLQKQAPVIVQAQEKPVSFSDQMTAPQDETDEGYWPSERT